VTSRRILVFCILLAALFFAWLKWRDVSSVPHRAAESPAPEIHKLPVMFSTRTFDPAAPPSDMPSLNPGENAVCDTNFLSSANVSGTTRQAGAAHAYVTITQIRMTLQLNIAIWVPAGVSEHVMEHENGHRQISEYYYQTADKVAARIAATYLGKQVEINGADLNAESGKALEQMAADITEEYNKELNPGPTQLLYDTITDHSRNEVVVKDAVAAAIRNTAAASRNLS
jgi:hypothetical protein